MSRMKSIFAVLVLTAIVGVVPQARAATTTLKVIASGSSAMWQTMALGAYNNQVSIVSGGGATCHWTSASNAINLTDTRPTPVNNDPGTLWIVWDNNTAGTCDGAGANVTTNVWAYLKVDSVVGVRCYFAQPHCNINGTNANLTTTGANQISSTLWGDSSIDNALPLAIETIFQTGTKVTAAATDIRPEDAAFAACRVNSALGASAQGSGSSDGVDGLGYNPNNAAGVCPAFVSGGNQNRLVGSPILSGVLPATGAQANVLAFNITGHDPFNNTTVPAFTTYAVGAAPIIFITERDKGQLSSLTNASETQLQQVFSGTNCDASAFGLAAGGINIFLREPLSGTENTTESTVFRRPTVYPGAVLGLSQELHVNAPVNNPLKAQAGTCLAGAGARYRGIGTGEVVNNGVKASGSGSYPLVADGIAYAFFSYGNVGKISNNASYGYITLNGIDPIFQTYGSTLDPGQPATAGVLPAAANLPATCAGGAGNFPCNEVNIWKNGFSFPNLRNGTYRAWSLLRLVSGGTSGASASALATASNKYVVSTVPDYVPAVTVGGTLDLGLKLLRSHYVERDGAGTQLGVAGTVTNFPEKGGDMGGYILPTLIGVTTYKQKCLIQNATSDNDNLGPVARPDTVPADCQ